MISKEIGYSPNAPKFYKYNPNKEIYCINFGFKEIEDQQYSCYHVICNYKPSLEEVKDMAMDFINSEITNDIIAFSYNGYKIWLTLENQNDFLIAKAAGLTEMKIKAELDNNPVYIYVELSDFGQAMAQHINSVLEAGRILKDNINEELTDIFNTYAEKIDTETSV